MAHPVAQAPGNGKLACPPGHDGLARARQVYTAGCGLLDGAQAPWAGRPAWHILDTQFGLGLKFLSTWQAWRESPQAPARLFYTAFEPHPMAAADLRQRLAAWPEIAPLSDELTHHWWGLLPGVHRLLLDAGRVHLTLHVGHPQDVLPSLDSAVDSIFLEVPTGITPAEGAHVPWMKALGRLCRHGTRLAACPLPEAVRDQLTTAGFVWDTASNPGHGLRAHHAPRWTVRPVTRQPLVDQARRAIVVGAGLAGSAVAHSLAQRGWQVEVVDQADTPAQGASALPVGLVAPHVSPDDAALSRLSRSGVRLTLQRLTALLPPGLDWAPSGVLEHRADGKRSLPAADAWRQWGHDWSTQASQAQREAARLPLDANALWHGCGAWVRPARLVQAQLDHPNIQWRGGLNVARLARQAGTWQLLDAADRVLVEAETVILASAWPTRALLQGLGHDTLPLHPLRGQITWAPLDTLPPEAAALLPPFPMNGQGALVHHVEGPDGRPGWFVGSTFDRGVTEGLVRPEDRETNRQKLTGLQPRLAQAMAPAFTQAQDWAGVRCTLPDRVPAVGPVAPEHLPGLHVCTGLGARGLTLSVLCGEVLAALLHGEPWPTEGRLVHKLLAERFAPPSA